MICPFCGKETSATQGCCTSCRALITASSQVAEVAPDETILTHVAKPVECPPDFVATVFSPNSLTGSVTTGAVTMVRPPRALKADVGDVSETFGGHFVPDTTGLPPSAGGVRGGRRATRQQPVLAPGQALGGRYHIIRLLGAGGMGAVYQAWDAELNVVVALKVIRTESTADPAVTAAREKQFKNELLLARQVTHKHVVRIHDLGELEGIKYITMPYVQGEDLATVLTKSGPLGVPRALKLAREIAAGLQAAHEATVVHRDLKPANIMISAEDVALILDFGIAHSSAHGEGAAGVTGTLEYMAPEQAKGAAADQRVDIYAFGLILYEMLVGRRKPSSASNPLEDMKARIENGLPRLRAIDPRVPEAIDDLVAKCLEADPAARFQTSAELVAALDRLDENGEPIPEPRRLTWRLVTATAAVVMMMLGATYVVTRRAVLPQKQHEPVSVMIADFQNTTKDPAFERTLEPMLRRALEAAGFISAYDRSRFRVALGVNAPERLDEPTTRELALKTGIGVVLSGSIDRRRNGYEISVKAAQTVSGKIVTTATSRASNKDQVLAAATKLVTTVRKALGDGTSDSAQLLAMRSLSTTSIEVASHYATAMEAQTNGKFEEARQSLLKAVELDPEFGLGYQGLALISRNLGKLQDADKYNTEALRHLERMTDRERFAVRAAYYMNTGDSQQCVKEYAELIAQYAADVAGHNNRAICLSKLRRMPEAVEEMRRAVEILPRRVTFRANLAIDADYAGDFQTAEREAQALQEPTDLATLAVAFAQLGQGRVAEVTETYDRLEAISVRGASWAASGRGDLALYEGRFSDAARIFEQGAAADLERKSVDRAARKLTSLAYAQIAHGQRSPAITAAEKALQMSSAVPIRFLAARVFVEANAPDKARTIAAGLSAELPAEPQAYGKIIEGEIALKTGDPHQALKILTDANNLLDTWLGHFDLGRAYLELGGFPQADSEFTRCFKRQGEVLSLLVDEEPTYGYFPILYYYQGRVQEGLKYSSFADSYREYLKIRGNSTEDPLVLDARRRTAH